jgi:hypothetical protein
VQVLNTELLHTRLLPGVTAALVTKMKKCLPAEHCRRLVGADPRAPAEAERTKLIALLRLLEALLPAVRPTILRQRHALVDQQVGVLGDAESSLGDAKRARWVTLRGSLGDAKRLAG